MINLDTVADFGWSFHETFFLETKEGNFIWSDPYYGGDNTIRSFDGDVKRFCKQEQIPFVRCKGRHTIRKYCGEGVRFI